MPARTIAVLTVAELVFALSACTVPHEPLLEEEIGRGLRRIPRLDPEETSITKPTPLAEAPLEPSVEMVNRAKVLSSESPPPESVTVTLAEVRSDALANNLGIMVEYFSPSIAEESLNVERAKFDAVIRASILVSEARDDEGRFTRTYALNPSILTPSLTVPLNTGGTVSIGLPVSVVDSEGAPPDLWQSGLRFSISQPLLRGAGPEVNEASIRLAGLKSRQADARTKQAVIRLLANAERAYWNHYAAHLDLRVQVDQYEAAVRQLELARRLVAEGIRTQVEITRAEAGVAQRFESIVLAETTRRLAERALKRVINRLNLPVDSPTVIIPATFANPMGVSLDRPELGRLAISNRTDLFENEVQLAIDRITAGVEENLKLPALALDFHYSFSGAKPDLDSAIHRMFDKEENEWSAGLSFEIPLGNRAANARFQRAVLQHAQTMAARLDFEQAILQDVHNASDTLEQNWQRILSARRDVLLESQTYQAEIQQFQEGVVTSTEVLEAQARVTAAQSREIAALRDYQISRIDLAFATGTVLGISNVVWEPARAGRGR